MKDASLGSLPRNSRMDTSSSTLEPRSSIFRRKSSPTAGFSSPSFSKRLNMSCA